MHNVLGQWNICAEDDNNVVKIDNYYANSGCNFCGWVLILIIS